ncbi:MAG: ABC transporter permease [Candidatus Thorarchaeota archaeon]|nr:MAG: ABC transporter permease [Candidatus Thorarchaeota archaeon]
MKQNSDSQVNGENSRPPTVIRPSFSHLLSRMKRLLLSSYAKFVARKAAFYLVVIFFSVTLVFVVIESMPGDPVAVMIASGNPPPGADLDALADIMREYFGLDKPIQERFVIYLMNFFSGNLGQSYHFYPVFASTIILYYLPYTLSLAIPVLFVSFVVGNWIGARAAYLKGRLNETSYFALVFCNQLPPFWLGLVIIFLYVVLFRSIPPIGAATQGVIPSLSVSYFYDLLAHWILPFLTLLVVYVGAWATGMRSMVTHEKDSGYVRYGEQLGFKKGKLMSYTQRNAILPQFTGLNMVFSGIIGQTLVIEIVFGWPGLGLLLYNAVFNYDYPLIFGCFLVIIIIIVVGNFLIDILYGFIDPRIRTGHG